MRNFSIVLVMLVAVSPALAQRPPRGLSPAYRFNGRQVTKHFDEVVAPTSASTVRVIAKGKRAAMGVVVADGFVVTKLSEIDGATGVTLSGDKSFRAAIAAKDGASDLALLRVSGLKAAPVQWGPPPEAEIGHLVATVWPEADRARIGIVGAIEREIEKSGGVMGVGLGNDGRRIGGVTISQVFPKSGASEAGLKTGDIITEVNGLKTTDREALIKLVTGFDAGEEIDVTVRRGDETIKATVMLGHRSQVFDLFNRNQRMSGKTSKRKAGYERVIQHDIALDPRDIGGPVVNIDGKLIGINISRVDRVTTFALPVDVVKASVERMLKEAKEVEEKDE